MLKKQIRGSRDGARFFYGMAQSLLVGSALLTINDTPIRALRSMTLKANGARSGRLCFYDAVAVTMPHIQFRQTQSISENPAFVRRAIWSVSVV
jgi:hypothetical protein